eukprot:7377136-Prymnesium_polylepis.1
MQRVSRTAPPDEPPPPAACEVPAGVQHLHHLRRERELERSLADEVRSLSKGAPAADPRRATGCTRSGARGVASLCGGFVAPLRRCALAECCVGSNVTSS